MNKHHTGCGCGCIRKVSTDACGNLVFELCTGQAIATSSPYVGIIGVKATNQGELVFKWTDGKETVIPGLGSSGAAPIQQTPVFAQVLHSAAIDDAVNPRLSFTSQGMLMQEDNLPPQLHGGIAFNKGLYTVPQNGLYNITFKISTASVFNALTPKPGPSSQDPKPTAEIVVNGVSKATSVFQPYFGGYIASCNWIVDLQTGDRVGIWYGGSIYPAEQALTHYEMVLRRI